MSLPRDTKHDDEELARYVLGLLSDDATERLDEASIADDEVAARLRTAETDLIDSYVRGQLSGEALERFESRYLSSPRRRDSVRLAATFIRAVDRSAVHAETVTWKDRITRPTMVAWIVTAATLVIVAGGVLLSVAVRARNEPALAKSESGAVERRTEESPPQLRGEPAAGPAHAGEVDRDRPPAAASPSTSWSSRSPDGSRTAAPGQMVAVVLHPPTRAVAPIPTLGVPTGADHVSFELRLESNDFPRYRVELKNPSTNQGLWRSDWIQPTSSVDPASVSVLVPANLLGPQHYSLDLTGRDARDRAEVIGTYTIRIVQQP